MANVGTTSEAEVVQEGLPYMMDACYFIAVLRLDSDTSSNNKEFLID